MCLFVGPPQILSISVPTPPLGEMTASTGQPTEIRIQPGTSVTIYCPASGVDTPSIVWFRDSVLVTSNDRFTISTTTLLGAVTTGVLRIDKFRPTDAGTYQCIATNFVDSANGEVTLMQR